MPFSIYTAQYSSKPKPQSHHQGTYEALTPFLLIAAF